jgi:hypothetical protein
MEVMEIVNIGGPEYLLKMAGIGLGGKNVVACYDGDPRIPCRYGQKCYQKNPLHHQKYKHPPKRKLEVSYSHE